jgi:hypothetical protein
LARRAGADRIIQVAFLNESDFDQIEIAGQPYQIPCEVLSHFRNLRNITGLSQHPRISVFDCAFRDRGAYLSAALGYVSSFGQERCVVFLDPDTGLEPNGGGDAKHVLESEALAFWDALPRASVFAFYQHQTNRAGRPWIEDKRAQLARAIGLSVEELGVARGPQIANDVVFFYATKT